MKKHSLPYKLCMLNAKQVWAGFFIAFVIFFEMLINSSWAGTATRTESHKKQGNSCISVVDKSNCLKDVENNRMRKYQGWVKREGDALILQLDYGKTLRLKDNRDHKNVSKWITYSFRDFLYPMNYYLIEEGYWEGGGYALIDRKYGNLYKIDDVPIFSPDSRHFITVSICDAYCPYRLQVWKRNNAGLDLAWSFTPYEYWASGKAKWIGKRTIKITKKVKQDPKDPYAGWIDHVFYIKLMSEGWRIFNQLDKKK